MAGGQGDLVQLHSLGVRLEVEDARGRGRGGSRGAQVDRVVEPDPLGHDPEVPEGLVGAIEPHAVEACDGGVPLQDDPVVAGREGLRPA